MSQWESPEPVYPFEISQAILWKAASANYRMCLQPVDARWPVDEEIDKGMRKSQKVLAHSAALLNRRWGCSLSVFSD